MDEKGKHLEGLGNAPEEKEEETFDLSEIPELFEIPPILDMEGLEAERDKSFDTLRTLLAIEAVCRRLADNYRRLDNAEEVRRYEGTAKAVQQLSKGESRKYSQLCAMCSKPVQAS